MNTPLSASLSPETTDSAHAADPPAWAAEHLALLVELRDMGMVLARNLMRQVLAQTEAAEAQAEAGEAEEAPRRGAAVDPGLTFSRISRAVRLTIALEARLHRMIEAGANAANDDAADDAEGPIDYAGIRRRMHPVLHGAADYEIRRAVEETIEASCDEPDTVERLKDELTERLDEDEVFDQRANWPIGETIALICQDLGLEPDWDRFETRRWARKEAAESPAGSPYATEARPLAPQYEFLSGTNKYREARGLPPLDEPVLKAARGPP